MLMINAVQDQNLLQLVFQFQYDRESLKKQSLEHLANLLGHEGPGSLFQCLKQLKFATALEIYPHSSFVTVCKLVTLTMVLTEHGK